MSKAFFIEKSQKIRSSTYSMVLQLFGILHQLLVNASDLIIKGSELSF